MALYLGINNDGTFVSSDGYTLTDSNDLYLSALPVAGKLKIIFNGVAYHVNVKLPEKESE
jgi:hypothetical protein